MTRGFFNVPKAVNEPVKNYAPNSPETEELLATYKEMFNSNIDVPMHINGKEIRTDNTKNITPPHDHQHVVGQYHTAEKKHVVEAISTALSARQAWSSVSWMERASIFLKAAELLAGPYRAKMNAATMIAQSKNVHQAEIDAACEMIDFFRFNVQYMTDIFKDQPESAPGIWNRVEYRPLEGFVYAISPFNFTSIAANLPAAAALMGNVVVWKPSDHQAYSAQVIVDLFKEAGLPDGVINVVYGDPVMISDACLSSPDFSGLHFTGSTTVFKNLWKQIGNNIHTYKTYPRIVGETGGKDFIWAHNSANPLQVATAITRGSFEYQGQKCSAASRAYIPTSIWDEVLQHLKKQTSELKMGSPENPDNFVNAVIHEGSFDKIAKYIDAAKVRFAGDKAIVSYEAEIVLKQVYKDGINGFQNEMDDMIQKVVNQLKKNYRAVAGKSITLTAEGDGAKIDVEYVSRYRTLVHAVRSYKIGGLSDVVAATGAEVNKREMADTYKKFLEQGGFGKRPKNDTRPKNA